LFARKKKIRAVKIIQNEISTYSLCGPLDQADNCDFFLFQEDMAFFFVAATHKLFMAQL